MDLIPVAEVLWQMGIRETERGWVMDLGSVRRLRGDCKRQLRKPKWRQTERTLNRFPQHLATL